MPPAHLSSRNRRQQRGTWNQVFGNFHPFEIEVGMGKGRFIMEKHPGQSGYQLYRIERYSSVLLRGLEKRSEMDLEKYILYVH